MVGLTGPKEKTDQVAKAYRVHVSEGPPMEGNPNDYIGTGRRRSVYFIRRHDFLVRSMSEN
jgi:hypothetical protein